MLTFRLLGDFPPSRVHTTWTPTSSFRPSPTTQSLIDRTWSDKLRNNPHVHLFDGPMCRLESARLERDATGADHLHLTLSPTSYKSFLGTNMTRPELADAEGPAALANPLGLSCALLSSDGALHLGRRNDRVAYYPNRIHPFAGAMEPREGLDVFAELRRELHEELALTDPHLADTRCLGLIEDPTLRQPELIFLVRSTLPRSEITQRLDAREHLGTLIIDPTPDAASRALPNPLLTPVALGTILLWGRTTFGAPWFSQPHPT